MKAVVQVPAFQEEGLVGDTLRQITRQRVPGSVDVDVEAWVTPSPSDVSECGTYQEAGDVPGVEVHEAPSGKISTRNVAHDSAAERGYDVVVVWDADAPPMNDKVLVNMLSPFANDPDVVATNSRPTSPPTVIGLATNVLGRVEDTIRPHMHGQCSAFTTNAWYAAGPFEENLDQTEMFDVRTEEEFDFYRRLEQVGDVVYCRNAMVMNHPRRAECMIGARDDEFCYRRGQETFAPAE